MFVNCLHDTDWGAGRASGEERPLAWALTKASVGIGGDRPGAQEEAGNQERL